MRFLFKAVFLMFVVGGVWFWTHLGPQRPSRAFELVGARFELALLTPSNELFSLPASMDRQHALLVFYRGPRSQECVRELVRLDRRVPEFEKLGVSVYAISADEPREVLGFVENHEFHMRFACDPHRAVIRILGIEGSGLDGSTIAHPVRLLIDRSGRVLWGDRAPDTRGVIDLDRLLEVVRARVSR